MKQVYDRIYNIYYKYEILIYVVVFLIVSLLLLLQFDYSAVVTFLAIMGVTIIVDRLLRMCRRKRHDDERIMMIMACASTNSLITTAVVMAGLELLVMSHAIREPTFWQLFGIIDMTIVLTFFGWSAYYLKKGNVY